MSEYSAPPDRRHLVTRVISQMEVGGIQRGIIESLTRLDREHFRAEVLCLQERGEWAGKLAEIGVDCELHHKSYSFSRLHIGGMLKYFYRMSRLLAAHGTSILHIHQARPSLAMIPSGKLARVPCIVVHHHSLYTDHYWNRLTPWRLDWERRATNRADAVIAVSQVVADCTHEVLRIPKEKIFVVPNGVSLANSGAGEASTSAPLPETPAGWKVIGGIGRLVKDKCWDDFIRAAKLMRDRGVKAHFWLVGDAPTKDSHAEELRALVAACGLADHFHFFGFRNDIARILGKLDAGVLCSRREGFSIALLEYMAAGVPSVVSDIPRMREIVVNEREGLIVPLNDSAALADALARIISEPALEESLRARGLERAKEFSWEATERAYEKIYRTVLEAKGKWAK